jgi:hypothetical protein
MTENNDFQMVDRWLRLPLFLQQAGRMAEAEEEFNKLLGLFKRGYELSHICDKMRLTYQREKRFDEAVVFGVMSLAYEMIGTKTRIEHEKQRLQELMQQYDSFDYSQEFLKKQWKSHIKFARDQLKKTGQDVHQSLLKQQSELQKKSLSYSLRQKNNLCSMLSFKILSNLQLIILLIAAWY